MPIWLCIVAVILAISVSTVVTYYFASNAFNERYNASLSLLSKQRSLVSADLGDIYRAMDEIAIQYEDKYIYDVDYKKLADNILYDFAIETGDRYGAYYTAEDWAEETADSNGNSVGLGIYVTAHFEPGTQIVSDGLTVLLVMEDSPASEAGLMKGDLIKIIDGTAIKGMDYNEAVALSSGEIGTDAHITVERDGSDVEITVHRGKYSAQTVISNIIEANGAKIGYIKITEFYEITVDQFKNAVKSMLDAGCTGLVYDLRSNPGGYLDAVVNMLDYLVPAGPIVRITDVKGNVETYRSDAKCIENVPMVILTDGSTASAAELFTSTLRDYKYATVVGTKTYGKGCGQTFYPMSNGGYVKLTTFLYSPPYSDNYDGIGIYPDVEVDLEGDAAEKNLFLVTYEEDAPLQTAVQILTENK